MDAGTIAGVVIVMLRNSNYLCIKQGSVFNKRYWALGPLHLACRFAVWIYPRAILKASRLSLFEADVC